MKKARTLVIGKTRIARGTVRDIRLPVSETYSGSSVNVFVRVIRSRKPGPNVFLTGAVHGDELNGMGIIRQIMLQKPRLLRGTLICVPLANVFGFENHTRYLPDRRDLNRSFPGSPKGSLGYRLANILFREIIQKCDYGIDLHSAAVRRTNFPQVRADLSVPGLESIATAFGCELIVNKKADPHSLRGVATAHDCPTVLYEAGEVFKFEPGAIQLGMRGVFNVLKKLGMLRGEIRKPAYQTTINKSRWIRSDKGGILSFQVRPGDLVRRGIRLGSIQKIFTSEVASIRAPQDGIVLGITTLPAVKPGEPICHLAHPTMALGEIAKRIAARPGSLHRRVQKHLATNIRVVEKGGKAKKPRKTRKPRRTRKPRQTRK